MTLAELKSRPTGKKEWSHRSNRHDDITVVILHFVAESSSAESIVQKYTPVVEAATVRQPVPRPTNLALLRADTRSCRWLLACPVADYHLAFLAMCIVSHVHCLTFVPAFAVLQRASESQMLTMAREIFEKIDVDGSGSITADELALLARRCVSPLDCAGLW